MLRQAEQKVRDFQKQLMESFSYEEMLRELEMMLLWEEILSGKYKKDTGTGQPELDGGPDDPPGNAASHGPTITQTVTESTISGYGITATFYTKVIIQGDPQLIFNINRFGDFESVSFVTPVGMYSFGVNSLSFGPNQLISFGIKGDNYTVSLDIPYQNSSIGGVEVELGQTMIQRAIIFTVFLVSPPYFKPLFSPIRF